MARRYTRLKRIALVLWYSAGIMQEGSTAKDIARWVALGALFLIPLTPLLVANHFFFPFITGKAFYFRTLVEIAVAAWVVLAFLDKAYRPRFSWVSVVVLAFVVWMFIADLFAVNVLKAFWSNFERMEGWILLIHLLGFFFAASAVLRVGKQWRTWFLISLGVSVVVCFHAFLQLTGGAPIHQGSTRIDASLGNSAYLAIYLLFNTFIAGWLALTEKRAWLKWSLLVLAVGEAVLVFFTETRGTILGLVGALLLAGLLTAATAGRRARRVAAGAVVLIVVLSGSFYLARNSSFVQGNHILQRIATISLADGQTRFTLWHMAYQGFLERPVVGWGQDGFNYVFNKYYDPSLYHQEPWFDRAHNAFLDWLMAGGLPAFLLYLALFGSAVWMLWRSSELSRAERVALTAALAGYACHNLFVFDNLYSYVYFFAILALIDAQTARPIAQLEKLTEVSATTGATYALPIGAVAALALIWFVNVPGIRAATTLISAISISGSSTDISANIAAFQDLAAHPSFAMQEIREQMVSAASSVASSQTIPDAQKQQLVALTLSEMQKQVTAYPNDTRERLQFAFAYRAAGDSADALKQIQAALTLAPHMEQVWIQAGVTEWDLGAMKAAQDDFNTAYALAPQFADLAAYAAAGDYMAGDVATGDAVLTKAFGTTVVDNDLLAVAYYRTKAWPRLIALWQLRVGAPSANVNTWFSLASAYYAAGNMAEAIATIQQTIAKFPEAKEVGTAIIAQIRGGTAGQ